MELGKSALVVVSVLAVFALVVAGTSNLTGNIANDVGMTTNPVMGLVSLVVFVVAVFLVLKVFVPENRFQ